MTLFAADPSGMTWTDFGQVGAWLAMGYYFLQHLQKKDDRDVLRDQQWAIGENERTKAMERLGDKFDTTVRQFQADQRTLFDQMMALCKGTVETVTENTNAIAALTKRIDDFERRNTPGGGAA